VSRLEGRVASHLVPALPQLHGHHAAGHRRERPRLPRNNTMSSFLFETLAFCWKTFGEEKEKEKNEIIGNRV
jgi:hypothetical protein